MTIKKIGVHLFQAKGKWISALILADMKTIGVKNLKIRFIKDLFGKSEMSSNSNAKHFHYSKTCFSDISTGYEFKIPFLFVDVTIYHN